MINLFIDTNVFLSFYHLTNEDLEELKKLVALIDRKKIRLFLPKQVKNEFSRNRSAKIMDALRKLQDAKFNLSFPLFAKDYDEYTELREIMKKAADVHAKLIENIVSDSSAKSLSADSVVSTLFEKANNIADDDDLNHKAVMRVHLGNPPGKHGSIGDAVNWECLLKEVPNGEDIYIVSGDKDFRSLLSDGEVSEFLDDEWSEKKGSTLFYYSKISDFFKGNFPDIKIASEVERDALIQELASSKSFFSTHVAIGKLLNQSEFSPTQVEQLTEIPKSNNQVGWITGDSDVHSFYEMLLQKYVGTLQEEPAKRLTEIVESGNPRPESESDGDIPDF